MSNKLAVSLNKEQFCLINSLKLIFVYILDKNRRHTFKN